MTFHFRCVKITQEEKRTTLYNKPEEYQSMVDIHFSCIETNNNTYGFIALTLSIEDFKQTNYEIGKVYELKDM